MGQALNIILYVSIFALFILLAIVIFHFLHEAVVSIPADYIEAMIGLIALIYTINEYRAHKDRRKADVLASFNNRYMESQSVKRVLEDLIALDDKNTCKFCISENSMTCVNVINDRELFLRFFEELNYAIESDSIDKETVFDLFAYYALKADKLGKRFVSDYEEGDNWKTFKSFCKKMKKIKRRKGNYDF